MSKNIAPSTSAAGGGSAHSHPADLSSPVLRKALSKVHSNLSSADLKHLENDPSAPNVGCSLDEFITYLSHPAHSAIALPEPAKKDWTRPLNEYFISSSHNTYLVGHQLYGSSTTAGYVNVLSRGCRCIEIDVWDGDDGKPEVFHGYTLTKEIKFKDVCKAIAEHAFTDKEGEMFEGAGEGPVIVSLECHASEEQQEKMVAIMEDVWGDMLVKNVEPESVKDLPSPMELRRKILVKAKYIPAEPNPVLNADVTAPREPLKPNGMSSSSSSDSELEALSAAAKKQKPKKTKVIRRLARLGAYCSSHHFPESSTHAEPFTTHPTSLIPNHVYSFSEKVFSRHNNTYAKGVFEHNKKYLMRVYPFGLRFNSSNADPTTFWKHGVQLVALNWQKCDEGMMLNEGMFAGEGGYVLKPPGFCTGDPAPRYKKLDLKIEIIAAANVPLPDDDHTPKGFEPYVKVEIHRTADPGNVGKMKAKTKAKRGTECVWEQTLEFNGVDGIIEKLTLVRFKIHDQEFGKDDLAAWSCVRLDRLQEGYRVIRLFDDRGLHSKGVILAKIEKRVY